MDQGEQVARSLSGIVEGVAVWVAMIAMTDRQGVADVEIYTTEREAHEGLCDLMRRVLLCPGS